MLPAIFPGINAKDVLGKPPVPSRLPPTPLGEELGGLPVPADTVTVLFWVGLQHKLVFGAGHCDEKVGRLETHGKPVVVLFGDIPSLFHVSVPPTP